MGYVPFELPGGNDPQAIYQRILDMFAGLVPGWVARAGHPEVALMEAVASAQAEDRALIASVSAAVFGHAGESLFLLPRLIGTAASATATFTLSDTLGHTIPQGTQLLWDDGAGGGLTLSTTADVVVPPASGTATGVVVIADISGSGGNAITSGAVRIVDALSFVSGVTLTTSASGGSDDETDADYLDRLADYLQAYGATAVTATDFARLARNVPGVDRAVAIDGWSGVEPGTLNNEKTVGVVGADSAGQPLAGGVKTAVDAYLQSLREVNFVVVVTDATYTDLTVAFTATALPGRNPVDVKAAAEAAGYAYLSPATWGSAGGAHTWILNNVVSYLTLARAISTADGVDRLLTMTLNAGTANVTLTGRVALPSSQADGTSVVGTVT